MRSLMIVMMRDEGSCPEAAIDANDEDIEDSKQN